MTCALHMFVSMKLSLNEDLRDLFACLLHIDVLSTPAEKSKTLSIITTNQDVGAVICL